MLPDILEVGFVIYPEFRSKNEQQNGQECDIEIHSGVSKCQTAKSGHEGESVAARLQ